jgi:hypothetical protein
MQDWNKAMTGPKILVEALERGLTLPEGSAERFSGCGVMGLT